VVGLWDALVKRRASLSSDLIFFWAPCLCVGASTGIQDYAIVSLFLSASSTIIRIRTGPISGTKATATLTPVCSIFTKFQPVHYRMPAGRVTCSRLTIIIMFTINNWLIRWMVSPHGGIVLWGTFLVLDYIITHSIVNDTIVKAILVNDAIVNSQFLWDIVDSRRKHAIALYPPVSGYMRSSLFEFLSKFHLQIVLIAPKL
jgi:hypothetical protein